MIRFTNMFFQQKRSTSKELGFLDPEIIGGGGGEESGNIYNPQPFISPPFIEPVKPVRVDTTPELWEGFPGQTGAGNVDVKGNPIFPQTSPEKVETWNAPPTPVEVKEPTQPISKPAYRLRRQFRKSDPEPATTQPVKSESGDTILGFDSKAVLLIGGGLAALVLVAVVFSGNNSQKS